MSEFDHMPYEHIPLGFSLSTTKDDGTMIDYSESLIKIRLLRKKAHDAILDKKWDLAGGYADDLLVASRELKIWILDQEPL